MAGPDAAKIGLDVTPFKNSLEELRKEVEKFSGMLGSFDKTFRESFVKPFSEATTVLNNFSAPLNSAVKGLHDAASDFKKVGDNLQGLGTKISDAYANIFPKNVAADDAPLKKFQDIVRGFSNLQGVNLDAFSKVASGFKNLGSGLKGLSTDIDTAGITSTLEKVKEIVNKINTAPKGVTSSTGDTTFIDSSIDAVFKVGNSLSKLGNALKSLSDNNAITQSIGTINSGITGISSLFEHLDKLFVGRKVGDAGKEKIVDDLGSKTLAVARVSGALNKLTNACDTVFKTGSLKTNVILNNINTFDTVVSQLFTDLDKLFVGRKVGDAGKEKIVDDLGSKTLAVARVSGALNKLTKAVDSLANTNINTLVSKVSVIQISLSNLFTELGKIGQTTTNASSGKSEFVNKYVQDFVALSKALQSFSNILSRSSKSFTDFGSKSNIVVFNISNFVSRLSAVTRSNSFAYFERLANAMDKVSNASKNIVSATDKASKAVNNAGNSAKKAGGLFGFLSGKMGQVWTAFAGGTIIYTFVRSIKDAVRTAVELELAMARVNTIARVTNKELQNMTATVVKMSAKYGVSKKVISDALYDINSATIKGKDAMYVLDAAVRASVAGFTDTNKVAMLLSQTINAYGYSAKRSGALVDIMFKTVERGINPMNELTQYFGRLLTVSANAGVSFEEINAAVATLTSRGLQTNIAVTSLNSALLKLAQGNSKLDALFRQHGYASSALALRYGGLAKTLEIVKEATGGATDAIRKLGFNERNIRALTTLASESFKEFIYNLDYMNDSTKSANVTNEAMAKVMETVSHKMSRISELVSAIVTKFVDWVNSSTLLKSALDGVISALEKLNHLYSGEELSFGESLTKSIINITAVTLALLGLIKLGGKVKSLIKTFTTLSGTLKTLKVPKLPVVKTTKIPASKLPRFNGDPIPKVKPPKGFGVFHKTIQAVTGSLKTFWEFLKKIGDGFKSIFAFLKTPASVFKSIQNALTSIVRAGGSVVKVFAKIFGALKALGKVSPWITAILTLIGVVYDAVSSLFELIEYGRRGLTSFGEVLKGMFSLDALKGIGAEFLKIISSVLTLGFYKIDLTDFKVEVDFVPVLDFSRVDAAAAQLQDFVNKAKADIAKLDLSNPEDMKRAQAYLDAILKKYKELGKHLSKDEMKVLEQSFMRAHDRLKALINTQEKQQKSPLAGYIKSVKILIDEYDKLSEKMAVATDPFEGYAKALADLGKIAFNDKLLPKFSEMIKAGDLQGLYKLKDYIKKTYDALAKSKTLNAKDVTLLAKYKSALEALEVAFNRAKGVLTSQDRLAKDVFTKPLSDIMQYVNILKNFDRRGLTEFMSNSGKGSYFDDIFRKYKEHIMAGKSSADFYVQLSALYSKEDVVKLKKMIEEQLSDIKLKVKIEESVIKKQEDLFKDVFKAPLNDAQKYIDLVESMRFRSLERFKVNTQYGDKYSYFEDIFKDITKSLQAGIPLKDIYRNLSYDFSKEDVERLKKMIEAHLSDIKIKVQLEKIAYKNQTDLFSKIYNEPLSDISKYEQAMKRVEKRASTIFSARSGESNSFDSIYNRFVKHLSKGKSVADFYSNLSFYYNKEDIEKIRKLIGEQLSDVEIKVAMQKKMEQSKMKFDDFFEQQSFKQLPKLMQFEEMKKKVASVVAQLREGFKKGIVDDKLLEKYMSLAESLQSFAESMATFKAPTSITSSKAVASGSEEVLDLLSKQVFADTIKVNKDILATTRSIHAQSKSIKDEIKRVVRNNKTTTTNLNIVAGG